MSKKQLISVPRKKHVFLSVTKNDTAVGTEDARHEEIADRLTIDVRWGSWGRVLQHRFLTFEDLTSSAPSRFPAPAYCAPVVSRSNFSRVIVSS